MSELRALLLVCVAALVACKGSEPASDASKKAASAAKADEASAAEAGAAEAGAAEAGAVEGEAGAEAEAGAETETETGEDDAGDAPPLPESFEELGVEACDQYVADYVACIEDKVPEDQREAQRRVVFDNLEAWKQMKTSGPSAEQGLNIACRSAREQAKRDTQAWSCTW